MISFIVIGKNEEKYLEKCISSINKTIILNKLIESEIIYIDSDSIDNSINIVKSFQNINVYKISGNTNAALARNVGVEKSKGDILVFMDGDMELIPNNFHHFYRNNKLVGHDYTSGDFYNYLYEDNVLIKKELYHNIDKNYFTENMGGLFFIKRYLWFNNNGMRSCFRRSQDIDFSLRMAQSGTKMLLKKTPIAIHHTIYYNSFGRFNRDLFSGNFFYHVLLIKYNLFNRFILKRIRREFNLFIIIISLLLSSLFNDLYYLFIIYFIFIFMKLVYKKRLLKMVKYIYIYIALDMCGLISLFVFWPKNIHPNEYEITKI
jgi:glycosyltransferase involved in cell wall biosynthesis